MWWFLVKQAEGEDVITYTYGVETKEQSGKISFNKHSEEFTIEKLADGDTEKGVEKLFPHLWRMIFKENCPDERQIAIG